MELSTHPRLQLGLLGLLQACCVWKELSSTSPLSLAGVCCLCGQGVYSSTLRKLGVLEVSGQAAGFSRGV